MCIELVKILGENGKIAARKPLGVKKELRLKN